MGRGFSYTLVANWFLAVTATAHADPAVAEPTEPGQPAERQFETGQRNFGVLVTAGTFLGMAAGVRAGTPAVGVQGTFGWAPTLQGIIESDRERTELRVFGGYLVAGDAFVRALTTKKGSSAGALAGYRYFSVLGHGFALGGYGMLRLSRAVDGFVNAGIIVYPDGDDRLRRNEDIPRDADFAWPGPRFSTHFNLGLVLFP